MQLRHILGTVAVTAALALPFHAYAADPIKVGILIPGSKSDKGWMESGYDGLVASEKKYGDKIDATLSGPDGGPIQTENTIVEYIRQRDKKDPV